MKKLVLPLLFLCAFNATIFAQVGIGTTTPNTYSVLDLTSTSKAFIPPRMSTVERAAILTPVAGMMIFNTTTTCIEIYRGSGWYNLCTGATSVSPAITSFLPTSGPVGTTVVITGTNLTGASVKFNGTAAVVTTNTATSITTTVPAGATTGPITVTTTDGTATSATNFTVGSALNSNSVAAANLIAHWTFDNTKAEAISGITPATTGTTTYNASGRIGAALDFSSAYLLYPPITNLNKDTALAAGFTFSTWAKFASTTGATNLFTSLWGINGNIGDIFSTAGFSYRHGPDSTLDFDGLMTHVNGTGTHSTAFSNFLEGPASGFKAPASDWVFITMVYDTTGGTKKIKYYGNGVLKGITTIATTVIPAAEQFELITTTSFGGTGRNNVTFGSLNYSPTPFAAGGGSSAGWQNTSLPTGTSIDDTRVFNKALSGAEITSLYNIGLTGN